MGFSISGYVLEKPRVGTANSPFTITPDNVITDFGAFSTAFPGSESEPRAEYMTLVLADGDLADAEFGWTKNDLVQRFYWEGRDQRFKTLPGAPPTDVGTLTSQANTTRLKVAAPKAPVGPSPVRLAVGAVGLGTEFTVQVVATDAAFTTPPQGVVQVSLETGQLNWNPVDLTAYEGQKVLFQRQQFFTTKESSGSLGKIPPSGNPTLLLNPIPGPGQHPLVRIGFGLWLSAVEVAAHSADPDQGTVEWQTTTGLLKFNSQDIANNRGAVVYYDGVLFARRLFLSRQTVGTVASPGSLSPVPLAGSEVIFRAVSTVVSGSATFPQSNVLQTGASLFNVKAEDAVVLMSGPFAGVRRRIVSVNATSGQLTVTPPFPSRGACNFDIERKHVQFGETLRQDALTDPSSGQVAYVGSGGVATSFADKIFYGAHALIAISGDLPIEHGVALRFFRTPVDTEATSPDIKDVSAFYPTKDSTLMDPLVGSPFVILPIVPIDDPAFPMTIKVVQGTGLYPEGPIPRLDVGTPSPASAGYGMDFDQRQLNLVARKNGVLIPMSLPTGALQLPDPLVDPDNILLERDTGAGYAPLTVDEDILLDDRSGLVRFISKVGNLIAGGTGNSFTGTTVNDNEQDFTTAGVQGGDILIVPAGNAKGVYTVQSASGVNLTVSPAVPSAVTNFAYEVWRGREVLADRFFQEVQLVDPSLLVEKTRKVSTDLTTNSPRLSIPVAYAESSTVRLGPDTYCDVVLVPTDGDFGSPISGLVEVSKATGNLNFSTADLGQPWFWVRRLVEKKDFRLEPITGFIQLIERLLANDEVRVTYTPYAEGSTTDPGDPVTERATFLVRKEVATYQPSSQSKFNKFNKTVADFPPPSVFRGGRPQDSTQVSVDVATATVTFLPDDQVTDALPHGSDLGASERVYVDYFVYEAIGGENTTNVLKPPMYTVSLSSTNPINGALVKGILEGNDTFMVPGDQTAKFPPNHVLRVGTEELYLLEGSTFNGVTTTVRILAPQTFRTQVSAPQLYVSSGPVAPWGFDSYFLTELSFDRAFGASGIPRGMNVINIPGDRASAYPAGTVIYLSAPGTPNSEDVYLVLGAAFEAATGQTAITLTTTTARQYNPPPDSDGALMRRSVRPIYEASAKTVQTSQAAIIEKGLIVYRQVAGQVGEVVAYVKAGDKPTETEDFRIDQAGRITFKDPLKANEEFSILYTGYALFTGTFRASYTHGIVPNATNGLENQRLMADFTAYAPDTFFYRVEPLTNFRAEIAKQYKDEAKASVPSGGPNTSNSSKTPLYNEGSKSVFFDEGRYWNEDFVARSILKFYNDVIHYLEDVLQNLDGRVVGDSDGRFKFDGTLGSQVASISAANNQIDDVIKISPFPIAITMPGFSFTFIGTYLKAYLASGDSRFYPTAKSVFGVTTGGDNTGAGTGDPILDFKQKDLLSISTIFRRPPRALLVEAANGTTTVKVDDAGATDVAPDGKTKVLRPAFANDMKVWIPGYAIGPLKIVGISGQNVTLDGAVTAPKGATLTLHPADSESDNGYQKAYRPNFDIGVDMEKGQLSFIDAFPPFDGSFPIIPDELCIQEPDSNEMLQANVSFISKRTEPFKFPALFGQPLNDDGDQAVPYLNPSPYQESSLTSVETAYVAPTGTLLTNAVAEYTGTGTLDVTQTIITLTSGTFPAPAPQVWDLVYILDGLNGNLTFRRISAVTANSVTVDVAFPFVDSNFQFMVTVASNVATGTATVTTPTTVQELFATFPTVEEGHTIIFTNGSAAGTRRQVTAVAGDTITFSPSVSGLVPGSTFRVANPLATYSETGDLVSALDDELAILLTNPTSSKASLDAFFNGVFTDKVGSTAATVSGTTLSAPTADFTASGVVTGHFLYIESGANAGVYPIAQVTDANTLEVDPTYPFPGSGAVTFRVCSAYGVTQKTLLDVSKVRSDIITFTDSVSAFRTLVNTAVAVSTPTLPSGDSTYFARAYRSTDLSARYALVTARQTAITDPTGPIATIEKVLTAGDRLYEKRFTWIDARINLEKGILTKQTQAFENRVKAQAETVKQLIKLLAVQG